MKTTDHSTRPTIALPRPRAVQTAFCLLLAGLIMPVTGCKLLDRKGRAPGTQANANARPAESQEVIAYLNKNAKAIQSLKVDIVDVDAKAEGRPVTLRARLAYQEPKDFRLSARAIGKSELDLGSNNNEVWFWVARANPPTVFFCKRDEIAGAKFPTPFNPDWLIELLGVAPIDPTRYREGQSTDRFMTLVSNESTPGGQAVIKRLVIDRRTKRLQAFELFGPKAERLAHAQIVDYTEDAQTGHFVPHKIRIDWPAADTKVTITLRRGQTQINQLSRDLAQSLFVRGEFAGSREINLAQMQPMHARGPIDQPIRHQSQRQRTLAQTQTAFRVDAPNSPNTNQKGPTLPGQSSTVENNFGRNDYRPATPTLDRHVQPARGPAARLDGRIERLSAPGF